MCVYVCVCVRAKKKTCLIRLRYTRLTLPPFHLFNEKNICSSNGERFEIERFVAHAHTHMHTCLDEVTWELVAVRGGDSVGRRWWLGVFSLKCHNPMPLWIMAIFRDCNSRTNS